MRRGAKRSKLGCNPPQPAAAKTAYLILSTADNQSIDLPPNWLGQAVKAG
jgi:hypothetical protein